MTWIEPELEATESRKKNQLNIITEDSHFLWNVFLLFYCFKFIHLFTSVRSNSKHCHIITLSKSAQCILAVCIYLTSLNIRAYALLVQHPFKFFSGEWWIVVWNKNARKQYSKCSKVNTETGNSSRSSNSNSTLTVRKK